jgi:hypothetical protein
MKQQNMPSDEGAGNRSFFIGSVISPSGTRGKYKFFSPLVRLTLINPNRSRSFKCVQVVFSLLP